MHTVSQIRGRSLENKDKYFIYIILRKYIYLYNLISTVIVFLEIWSDI